MAAAIASLISLILIMSGAWLLIERTRQSGFADMIWSAGTGVVSAALALWLMQTNTTWRPAILAALMLVWGLRLASHILARRHGGDDPRYAALRKDWGASAPRRMFFFLQSQAIAGWFLSIGVLAGAMAQSPLSWLDALGIAICLIALWGERMADRQLAQFRATQKGGVCDVGLWSRSRHPNYFFEWLFWVGIMAIGLNAGLPLMLLALIPPVIMYVLLVHVSGIPPLEKHMLESRGEAFRAYQKRVPAFFPRLFSAGAGR